jgi:hypothetical protein
MDRLGRLEIISHNNSYAQFREKVRDNEIKNRLNERSLNNQYKPRVEEPSDKL